jgi:serine/threonine-protein kinase
MGEVYRARDTRLQRDVALKTLPEAFAQDVERLARFTREAQVLASLNHPHIAAIYGLEEVPAAGTSSPLRALVLELVEGPTLADRVVQGALPVDDALEIAGQVAEALEAAHEHGVVHRDLKPANVKLRPDGTVKVLDFGLAKLQDIGDAAADHPGISHLPTVTTPAMTRLGMILGTAAYMSPEQARGRPVDKRADVWAFGCVLYELLCGARAFAADDVSDTLAMVLMREPDWSRLPTATPPAIRTLLRRCLTKDPRTRLADLSAARLEIRDAIAGSPGGQGPTGTSPAPDDATVKRQADAAVTQARRQLVVRRVLPAAAAAAAALIAGWAWLRPAPAAPAPVSRFSFTVDDARALGFSARQEVALSPDGRRLVYVADNRLHLRALDEFTARPIPGTEGNGLPHPVFSPDGRWIAFNSRGAIKRVPSAGGTPVELCRLQDDYATGMTWGQTGVVIALGGQGIFRCPSEGGTAELLIALENAMAYGPQILPDGDTVIFTLLTLGERLNGERLNRWDDATIVAESLATHVRREILRGASDGRYLDSGHLLFARSGVMFAAPFDAVGAIVTGEAVAVVEGVRRARNQTTAVTHLATSPAGTMAYLPGPADFASGNQQIALANREGKVDPLAVRPGPLSYVRASRDGRRLAIASEDDREGIVWIQDLVPGAALRRLTFEGRNRFPIWSPDGQRVAFQSSRDGDFGIFLQRADGVGPAARLTTAQNGEAHVPDTWSPDGMTLAFSVVTGPGATGAVPQGRWALMTVGVANGVTAPFGAVTSNEPIGAQFSPNGRWMAYHVEDDGPDISGGVFVQPFPATGAIYQAPRVARDFQPAWSADGTELVYVGSAASLTMAAVDVTIGSSVSFGTPQSFPARVTLALTSGFVRAFDLMPDGRMVGPFPEASVAEGLGSKEIRVVLHWLQELKARVPSGR